MTTMVRVLYGSFAGISLSPLREFLPSSNVLLIAEDIDDTSADLESLLEDCTGGSGLKKVRSEARTLWPSFAEYFVNLVEVAKVTGNIQIAAERMSVGTRSLQRAARSSGLPHPKRVLDWCRTMHVANLRQRRCSVAHIVCRLNFSDEGSVRRLVKRCPGTHLSNEPFSGGAQTVWTEFKRTYVSRDRLDWIACEPD